jgi:hypothetical protein
MRHFLVTLALALISTAALAQVPDRDVLVTSEGVVYTVEQQLPPAGTNIQATNILAVSVQNGADTSHTVVPESLNAGFHAGAALAFDAQSKTLFVLWIHMPNAMSSELLVASYHDGKWQPAVSIDDQPYHLRSNLRLGITRIVSQLQKDGTYADAPAFLLHALWWDVTGNGEQARYAMLPIENGTLSQSSIEIHSLEEFVAPSDDTFGVVGSNFNPEILRHPAIVSSPMEKFVDVVYGDTAKNSIHHVTLQPIADVRLHIPVGIGGGRPGPQPHGLSAPPNFTADWQGAISVISRGDRLVFANAGPTALSYIVYSNSAWTDVKSIPIDSNFPAMAALAALDKMVSTQ